MKNKHSNLSPLAGIFLPSVLQLTTGRDKTKHIYQPIHKRVCQARDRCSLVLLLGSVHFALLVPGVLSALVQAKMMYGTILSAKSELNFNT
jgi:hypothetical protein